MDAVSTPRSHPGRVRPTAPVEVSLGVLPAVLAVVVLAVPFMVILGIAAAIVPSVPWWIGSALGLLSAAVVVGYRLRTAHDVVVTQLMERGSTVSDVRLANMVGRLALTAGVEEPDSFVFNDGAANAMIVARNEMATLLVTRGLLEQLEPVELEAVVADLLVRLRNGDAEAATIVAALYRIPIMGPLSAALFRPVATIGQGRLLENGRDLAADEQAIALTRYPPGLLQALVKIKTSERRPQAIPDDLDELWLVDPDVGVGADGDRSLRSSLDLRIDVLNEL